MQNSIDFESLYKTEFIDKTGKYKNVLGIKSNPYWYLLLENPFIAVVFIFLFIGFGVFLELPWFIGFAILISLYILSASVLLHNTTKYDLKEETLSPIIRAINPTFKYNYQNQSR